MRRWQFLLELLLHHAPMAGPLYQSFFLGCPRRLPLMACRSSFLWSRLAKGRIVLGDVSWQFGLSLFIIGRFFLLGMGLGLYIKWVGVAEFFDPTGIICIDILYWDIKFWWKGSRLQILFFLFDFLYFVFFLVWRLNIKLIHFNFMVLFF